MPEGLRQNDLSLVRFRTLLLDYYHKAAKTTITKLPRQLMLWTTPERGEQFA